MPAVSFLTPLASLFAVAAALPLAALLRAERRSAEIRRLLRVPPPGRGAVPVAVALALLAGLVAVAAAQPVVVRRSFVSERADAQVFFLFDTSRSMAASAGPHAPTRLERAKRLALRLRATLAEVPTGIASMTDRSLPNLMPTTEAALFRRTLLQSVGIDRPPPSQPYSGRATHFQALIPLVESNLYGAGVQRRLLVVFTDGEAVPLSSLVGATVRRRVTPVFVHVWQPGERIFGAGGRVDAGYRADPGSAAALAALAQVAGGARPFTELQPAAIARAARDAVGRRGTQAHVAADARIALAPWVLLGGVAPLGFLLWRRNA